MIEGRQDETVLLMTSWVDYDFLETYDMKLAEGRFFDESFTSDREGCVINESAMKNFGIEDIASTRFLQPFDEGAFTTLQVIGVVKDFNFESLRNPVGPYIFCFQSDRNLWGYITVRLSAQNYSETIKTLERKWAEFLPNDALQYYFLDEDFERMYIQERQNAQMAVIFSALAILIASLGLFGLTSFTVEQKTREIGVRKAMGSSVPAIYLNISKEIFMLITISAVIAWPLIYYIAGNWLKNFYYRIDTGVLSFLAGLTIALGISILSVSWKIMKAARVNPAQSLKYE
jgi:putative ABC transport system permease protein